jgi:hypothetical protein
MAGGEGGGEGIDSLIFLKGDKMGWVGFLYIWVGRSN